MFPGSGATSVPTSSRPHIETCDHAIDHRIICNASHTICTDTSHLPSLQLAYQLEGFPKSRQSQTSAIHIHNGHGFYLHLNSWKKRVEEASNINRYMTQIYQDLYGSNDTLKIMTICLSETISIGEKNNLRFNIIACIFIYLYRVFIYVCCIP